MTGEALRLEGVTRRFGSTPVLRGVDLTVRMGERRALIGPNGAGKSTLFNVVGGALRPGSGRVLLAGRDVTGERSHELARMGLGRSFQTTRIFASLTVFDNLRCAALCGRSGRQDRLPGLGRLFTLLSAWSRSPDIEECAQRALEALELNHVAFALAGTLDYGTQRRLDLGIALASGAHTLLLDEPTAGMNREEAAHAVALLREVSADKTLVLIEHDLDAVFALADRVSVLVAGRVIATGTPAEIRADEAVRAAYLGATPMRDRR
ncbi:amino acid/amide ABC transporter ATP-binding protein 1 (HAAT family) [Trinickia symbiotica]|uniref:ABC transporter ATP-binding protein n=1 Tax=Trinickia symbiotica TaxID=863227 RepID=A0A2N7X801_9BURK|nr:ABC transporter ATP-binding protein [Trinickia symbiotica]PMS37888.1 ABC transporter ATP-binding protein [Trinickia symbiotica]PPK47489.1 amino acid/amide ABC transporter ATP-binding protein 1 (HAAT family) [Trinickia symbiotica]